MTGGTARRCSSFWRCGRAAAAVRNVERPSISTRPSAQLQRRAQVVGECCSAARRSPGAPRSAVAPAHLPSMVTRRSGFSSSMERSQLRVTRKAQQPRWACPGTAGYVPRDHVLEQHVGAAAVRHFHQPAARSHGTRRSAARSRRRGANRTARFNDLLRRCGKDGRIQRDGREQGKTSRAKYSARKWSASSEHLPGGAAHSSRSRLRHHMPRSARYWRVTIS